MNENQKKAMNEMDLQVKQLAYILNRHPNHVSNVFGGRYCSPGLRTKIARVLKKPESYLWPEKNTDQH